MPTKGDSYVARATLDQQRQSLYGQFFYELQHNPTYLVRAASSLKVSQMTLFSSTLLLSIFGDQYSDHEEQMLLLVIANLLQREFDLAKEVGTFMRGTTCLSTMLGIYGRRPSSLNAIKDILGPIIDDVATTEEVSDDA